MTGSVAERLERLIPLSHKKTNEVYSVKEDIIFPRGEGVSPGNGKISFINDDQQLESFLESCRKQDKVRNSVGAKRFIENILHASSISLSFYKIDLAKWNLENKNTPTSLQDVDFIVVREDHLNDIRVAEFLEFYCRTPPLQQPRVIFIPNSQDSKLADRLRYVNSNIMIANISQTETKIVDVERSVPDSLADFSHLYEKYCFGIAGKATIKQITQWTEGAPALAEVALLVARTRARLLSAERHMVESEVDALLRRIDTMVDTLPLDSLDSLLHVRTTVLLQKLYCSEDPKYLSEAISLASTLGDELGLASCLRYTEFLGVHPALADHMYRKAEKIFRKYDAKELAIACENNRIVSSFMNRINNEKEFEEILEEIDHDIPSLYRRHDIYYNSGVRYLLDGKIDKAFQIFDDTELLNGRPLIVSSAELGRFICRYLTGGSLDPSEVMRFVTHILHYVQPSNKWHITNLLLNLLVLIRADRSLTADVLAIAQLHINVENGLDVFDKFSENKRLASSVGLASYSTDARIPGPFGDFYGKHGVTVPFYYIWS